MLRQRCQPGGAERTEERQCTSQVSPPPPPRLPCSAFCCPLSPNPKTFSFLSISFFCSTFINTRKITVYYFSLLADNWAGASRRWAWSVYTGGVTKNTASHLSLLVDCKMWPLPVVVVITRTGSPSDATNKAMLPYLKSNGWKWF